jgi:hypothetical protein
MVDEKSHVAVVVHDMNRRRFRSRRLLRRKPSPSVELKRRSAKKLRSALRVSRRTVVQLVCGASEQLTRG